MVDNVGIGFNADFPVPQMMHYANMADDHGLDSFWLHEHSFGRDALSYLNSAAQSTKRIRLGAGCLSPYLHHPVLLAMSIMTLQEASKGRVVLGLGTGFPLRLDAMGIKHDRPISALRETIGICREIWNGGSVSLDGKSFSLKNVKSIAGKVDRMIPIYIAGWKAQMLSLTGALADGYIAKGGESVQSLGRIISGIRASIEKHSRRRTDVRVCAYLLTFVGDSRAGAFEVARKDPFVNYMLSVQDDYLFEETGISPELKKPIAENYFKGRLGESSKYVTNEMLGAFTLCGTSDEVAERIEEYVRVGLDLPILQPISIKHQDIVSVITCGSTLISPGFDRPVSPW